MIRRSWRNFAIGQFVVALGSFAAALCIREHWAKVALALNGLGSILAVAWALWKGDCE